MITKNNHMDLRIVYLFRTITTIFVTSGKGSSYSAILEFKMLSSTTFVFEIDLIL